MIVFFLLLLTTIGTVSGNDNVEAENNPRGLLQNGIIISADFYRSTSPDTTLNNQQRSVDILERDHYTSQDVREIINVVFIVGARLMPVALYIRNSMYN